MIDNLTTICDECLENVGASVSHNFMGHQGLIRG
jgi:hypothetical protein